MRNRYLIAGLAVVFLASASVAFGEVVYDKDWADFGGSLLKSQVAGDLLELPGTMVTIEDGGFYPGLGGPADLTDGIWGGSGWGAGAAILRDYAGNGTPAVTLRYDFAEPLDITEIRVFASNPDGYNARSYHDYDVEYKLAGDDTVYTLLELVRSTEFGAWNGNTEFVEKTATYIYDDANPFLLQDVEYIRFRLYDTGQTSGGFWDPYDASDPRDIDGNDPAAFEGSGIQEVDVIPEPASLLLLLAGLALLRRR
jgi:hypothetical protein